MDAGLVAVGIRRLNELLEDDIDTRRKKENVGGVMKTVESLYFLLSGRAYIGR